MTFRILSVLTVAGLASASMAQNSPLGDGTALQKNNNGLQVQQRGLQRDLQVPGTGTPAPGTYRDIAAEVRFRNAIVTGNAPAGVAFRGSVGYTDPLDFRGRLGSDDLFKFRRDTLYSGAAGIGIRGTDALQYQMALSTGNVSPLNPIVNRGGPTTPTTSTSRSLDLDKNDASLVTGALRSSSTFAVERRLRPVFMGTRQPTAGNYERLMASSLTGLHYQPWDNAPYEDNKKVPAANAADPKSANQPITNGVDLSVDRAVSPFEEARKRMEKSLESKPAAPDDKAKPADGVTTTNALSAIDQRLAEIRNALAPGAVKKPEAKKPDPNAPKTDKTPGSDAKKLEVSGTSAKNEKLDPFTLKAIKDSGAKTDTLVSPLKPDAPIDSYNRYMMDGQKALKDTQFFTAEERFALALNLHPGDLGAMVGRLHAQIGAGMKISANLNLRRLITEHPEAMGMTYDIALMGGQARVDALRDQLRSSLSDPKTGRESALLLAYLGRQRGEEGKADLEAGLKTLDDAQKAMPKDAADTEAEGKLIELLKGVWNAR